MRGPEILERTGGRKDGVHNQVSEKDNDALQINDEELAGEGGYGEEERTRKKICTTVMARNGCRYQPRWPGAIRVWSAQGASVPRASPKTMPLKAEDGGDEGTCPAAAEISELGDRLGEDELVGVALEVAQDRGAEDGRNDQHAEEADDECKGGWWRTGRSAGSCRCRC